jgi:5-methylcytosine-specific restriction protein B
MALDERIAKELRTEYQSLLQEGNLLSREQLASYYTTFRRRFGPDKLKSLDGQELLETMHSHGTKDSLVYWLEFKNDDEFPSTRFSSIAGGSAYKFALFCKQDTGQWIAGTSPKNAQAVTLDEAIEKAKSHRDQLVQGAELLERLPADSSDEVYERLQKDMERVAPDVNDLVWGHKYFSLLYPEKLDDFHNANYQRFHLLKLLQLPPQSEGSYLAAGRFVAIAQLLGIPMNNLATMLNIRDGGNPYSYWYVGLDDNYIDGSWASMRDGGFATIDRLQIGDLTAIPHNKSSREIIQAALFPSNQSQIHQTSLLSDEMMISTSLKKVTAREVVSFRWSINTDDLVLVCNGSTVLGIGRVIGPYAYVSSSTIPHRLPVKWLSLEPWKLSDTEGLQTTVHRMGKDVNVLEAEKRIYERPVPSPKPEYDNLPDESQTLPPLLPVPARIQTILERKGQVILYGPPGTGKTYWAEKTAYELASRANYDRAFDDLTNEQRAEITGTQGFVRLCSFHPAYGYEDFLEGFRPEPVNGQMHFTLRDGIFKKLCDDAKKELDKKFYLIIDEINRGDIPRIFGELLTVLEKNKRGKSILLPLTGKAFFVPDNVYVIGTMNTADRSIALLDTALRRRFGFLELMPNIDVLGDTVVDGIPLGPWLEALNGRILEFVGRDARNLQLGHSYLLEGERPLQNFSTFARVVQEDIFPLLEEYCYEDYTKLESILGSEIIDRKKQQFRQELFEPAHKDELITALLAIAPEITTSRQAIASEIMSEELNDELKDDGIEENGNNGENEG